MAKGMLAVGEEGDAAAEDERRRWSASSLEARYEALTTMARSMQAVAEGGDAAAEDAAAEAAAGSSEAAEAEGPEAAAARLLAAGCERLVRTLALAAGQLGGRSSDLWLLAQGFHALGHRRRCELVAEAVRGLGALPAQERADVVVAIAPRVRRARRGWRHVADAAEFVAASQTGAVDRGAGAVPPLVGREGRAEAEPEVVELLDAVEASLRRVPPHQRQKLHRRLDHAVSEWLPPAVLAQTFAWMPPEEVAGIEAWLVEEGALHAEAARSLFGALAQASGTRVSIEEGGAAVRRSVVSFAEGAGALWEGLSDELQRQNVDAFWPSWLRGQAPSPSPSLRSVPARAKRASVRVAPGGGVPHAAPPRSRSASSAGRQQPAQAPRRSARVSRYCAPEAFLLMGAGAQGASSSCEAASAGGTARGGDASSFLSAAASAGASAPPGAAGAPGRGAAAARRSGRSAAGAPPGCRRRVGAEEDGGDHAHSEFLGSA